MDILMSETCWAHNKWNKIASNIKLVFHSSTIAMMRGPINIRLQSVFAKSVYSCWVMVTEIQAMYYHIAFTDVRATTILVEKQKLLHILAGMLVALSIQHAMRIRYTIICGLPGCTIFFYVILLTANFREKKCMNKYVCFHFPLQLLSGFFFFNLRRIELWDMIKNIF